MDLRSHCAFEVANVVWRPGHGSFAFMVVCKATFELQPGESSLAEVQEPVLKADVYAPGGKSLSQASDLVPFKKRPEVLVLGHAYAPEGRASSSLTVRVALEGIDKRIQVLGDRFFDRAGQLSAPVPFTRMPLVWERAACGADHDNPVGKPTMNAAQRDLQGRIYVPNLLPWGFTLRSHHDVIPPTAFGPIAPTWPSRVACFRRCANWWHPDRWYERPLSTDIDVEFFNAAPADQQRTEPFAAEALYLENLHPHVGRLRTRLAPVTPMATVDQGSGPQPLVLRCDTMVINTDRGIASLVWRGHVPLDHPDRAGCVVITDAASSEYVAPTSDHAAADAATTLVAGLAQPSVAWPFASSPPPQDDGRRYASPQSRLVPSTARTATRHQTTPTVQPDDLSSFDPSSTMYLDPALIAGRAALPFGSSHEEAVSVPAPREEAPSQPPPPGASPTPPPILSPIPFVSEGIPKAKPNKEPPLPEAPAQKEGLVAEVEADTTFEAYPPDRCARIAARIACDESSTSHILDSESLDAARWERTHELCLHRIHEEVARRRKKLLAAYDSAYVSTLDEKHRVLSVAVYAKLAEAAERGAVAAALAEHALPESAWPHLHRVWIERIVKDGKLGREVRASIDSLRAASEH